MSDGVQGGNGEKNAPQEVGESAAQRLAADLGRGPTNSGEDVTGSKASEVIGVAAIDSVEFEATQRDSSASLETPAPKIVDRSPTNDLANTGPEHFIESDGLAHEAVELDAADRVDSVLSPTSHTSAHAAPTEKTCAVDRDARSDSDLVNLGREKPDGAKREVAEGGVAEPDVAEVEALEVEALEVEVVEVEVVEVEPVEVEAAKPEADDANTAIPVHKQPVKRGEAPKLPSVPDLRTDVFTTPTLFHFASSMGVTRVLERLVENALASNRPLDHVLLHGPPGCGTTIVARAIVRDLAPKNFVELDLLDGVDQEMLRRAIREVRNQGVLLIRHIELMSSSDEQFLMSCIARKTTRGTGSFARDAATPTTPTKRKKQSIDEFQVDATPRRSPPSFPRIDGNFTLIGTAHLTQQIGYQLRHRFDHMIHLRSDAVGVRIAINRVLTRHGYIVEESAHAPIERFVRTIDDVADQFVRAIVMRAQLDETAYIDDALVRAVVTEDMPARIADEVYGWALTRHLAGRRVTSMTDNEIERIDTETGWGEVAVRAALGVVVRNAAARAASPAA